jgi:anti-sigma factor RsiW
MNCKGVESRLSAYLDGELTGQEMLAVREHLSYCRECRQEETSLRGLKRMLCSLSAAEPPVGFEEKLAACVMRSRPEPRSWSIFQSALVFAGVAGCTMFATLQLISHPQTPPQAMAAPMAQDSSQQGIAFQVRHDEMTTQMSDPISGSPVWSAAESR